MYAVHTWNDVNNYIYKQNMFKIHLDALQILKMVDKLVDVNRKFKFMYWSAYRM